MAGHTVHSYDKELAVITTSIGEMGKLVQEMVNLAYASLKEPATNLVDVAKATDKKINALDTEIERQAIRVLALRQPMAVDLRLVSSALKIAVIMERMGDLAKNTVKRGARITTSAPSVIQGVGEMTEIILLMLQDTLVAFEEGNSIKAQEVIKRDGEVDNIYRRLMAELEQNMVASPSTIPSVMQLVFSVKNIERIGDYVTKTAKMVHYIVSGERLTKPAKTNS